MYPEPELAMMMPATVLPFRMANATAPVPVGSVIVTVGETP